MNRKSIATVFSLIALPFSIVWTLAEGSNVRDAWFPAYRVESVQGFKVTDTGFDLDGVVIHVERDCVTQRQLYISTVRHRAVSDDELIIPVLKDDGSPYMLSGAFVSGQHVTLDHLHASVTRDTAEHIDTLRLMVGCRDFSSGALTRAYSNPVRVRG